MSLHLLSEYSAVSHHLTTSTSMLVVVNTRILLNMPHRSTDKPWRTTEELHKIIICLCVHEYECACVYACACVTQFTPDHCHSLLLSPGFSTSFHYFISATAPSHLCLLCVGLAGGPVLTSRKNLPLLYMCGIQAEILW